MAMSGTVKFFNDMKGFGFIESANGDVFVHINDCGGAQPVEGDQVSFDEDFDQNKQKTRAINVQGCTGVRSEYGGKGGGFGGKGGGKGFGGKGDFGGYGGGYQQGGYW